MTGPIWMASPPEVHSALLSSGPGPGSLLAAAAAWKSLSAEYTAAADELGALLASVQAGVWQGPSAESYVAANMPYLVWLIRASADSAAAAAQHETVAAAYTAALAAMPTLAELAANHAVHAVLVAANFFGVNTIAIALNEADYVRMWTQAATTMATYQIVSSTAVASTPQTDPAPRIQKASSATASGSASSRIQDSGPGPTHLSWYTTRIDDVIDAAVKDLSHFSSNPSAAIYNLLHDPVLTTDVPHWAGELYLAFAPQLTHLAQLSFGLIAPVGPIGGVAGLAAPAGLAGLAGVAGVGAVPEVSAAAAAPVAPVTAPTPVADVAPVSSPVLTPAPTATTTSAPAPVPAAATAAPVPPAPGATPPPPITDAQGFGYLVSSGHIESTVQAHTKAKAKVPVSDTAAAALAADPAREQVRRHRRPGAGRIDRGHRYEYMVADLDSDVDPEPRGQSDAQPAASTLASGQTIGPLGFAGAVRMQTPAEAAGFITLAGDEFGVGPTVPMLPGSWNPDEGFNSENGEGHH
ncbi:PPE family protein [Candidatus Mycobacterium methanotrophicum]|uniref:PPE family protein n=1 Tax=Candidatus Mycobacterium methanotrophicum TaxID=2943498 RepID=A0ABY4QT79_9MYCO|nr:PPE family protein [Candidatus Mycobacterium methanotrophicum]UQX12865.1 PPE family protein [Candidatus Mycobacterium methanotrophicum]